MEPLFPVVNEEGVESEEIVKEAARRHWELFMARTNVAKAVLPFSSTTPTSQTEPIVPGTKAPSRLKQEPSANDTIISDAPPSRLDDVPPATGTPETPPVEFSFPVLNLAHGGPSRFQRKSQIYPQKAPEPIAPPRKANSFFARTRQRVAPLSAAVAEMATPTPSSPKFSLPRPVSRQEQVALLSGAAIVRSEVVKKVQAWGFGHVAAPPSAAENVPITSNLLVSLPVFHQGVTSVLTETPVVLPEVMEGPCLFEGEEIVYPESPPPLLTTGMPSPHGSERDATPARSDISYESGNSSSSGFGSFDEGPQTPEEPTPEEPAPMGYRGLGFRGKAVCSVSVNKLADEDIVFTREQYEEVKRQEAEANRKRHIEREAREWEDKIAGLRRQYEIEQQRLERIRNQKPVPPPPRSKTELINSHVAGVLFNAPVITAQRALLERPAAEHELGCRCYPCSAKRVATATVGSRVARPTAAVTVPPRPPPTPIILMSAAEAARKLQEEMEHRQRNVRIPTVSRPPPNTTRRRRTEVGEKRKISQPDGYQSDEI
ncbi:hypothetical protein BV898_05388 [Hypsibius exemplaris]|uniref:Uncharacterized protein n=1 Tax=Hypsibius exemplaris TaxID=2072580 RepID=A0A1W0WZC4_HYPEX|nr:hypothetical protein BV898_05388 [Hypsibius exemplaris]